MQHNDGHDDPSSGQQEEEEEEDIEWSDGEEEERGLVLLGQPSSYLGMKRAQYIDRGERGP